MSIFESVAAAFRDQGDDALANEILAKAPKGLGRIAYETYMRCRWPILKPSLSREPRNVQDAWHKVADAVVAASTPKLVMPDDAKLAKIAEAAHGAYRGEYCAAYPAPRMRPWMELHPGTRRAWVEAVRAAIAEAQR